MFVRRAFFRWMFIASVVLPIWPLVGVGIFNGSGWTVFGLVIAMPILFIALLVVSFLVRARGEVRAEKAVSWTDVASLGAWHAIIIAFGFFTPVTAILGMLGIMAGLVAFWMATSQLLRSAADRARAAMAEYEQMTRQPMNPPRAPQQVEEFIVVKEERRSSES